MTIAVSNNDVNGIFAKITSNNYANFLNLLGSTTAAVGFHTCIFTSSLCISSQDVVSCIPCTLSCPAGSYLTGQCTGESRSDDVKCLPCTATCPQNHYMSTECTGKTAKDEVVCLPCKTCGRGEYMAAVCEGTSKTDVAVCKVHCLCVSICIWTIYMLNLCEENDKSWHCILLALGSRTLRINNYNYTQLLIVECAF
jgi:hypothetical protein